MSVMDSVSNHFMVEAIRLSIENVKEGRGGPFAALVVKNGTIIARGTNLVTTTNDPTAHAEVVAIREACHALNDFQLRECELYSTCEPCPMCMGAIYWARPAKVFYASSRDDAARAGFDDAFIYDEMLRTHAERKIPMIQCMRDEALVAFREWNGKENKVRY